MPMNGLALLRDSRVFPSIFDEFFFDTPIIPSLFSDIQNNYLIDWGDDGKGSITIEAPGFKKDDIKVEVTSEGISIKGEIKDDGIKKKLSRSSFYYFIKRGDIDPKSVNAKLEDGILYISINRAKDKVSRIIPIE